MLSKNDAMCAEQHLQEDSVAEGSQVRDVRSGGA